VALIPACQPKIGDPCDRSFDCGVNVVRQCDVSNSSNDPEGKGECTLENCSLGICPKEAICVKVYGTEFLSVACDPDLEDILEDGLVQRDDCAQNEVCLREGLCADEITARTSCRLECENDEDCRSAYTCKATGVDGVYVAPDPDDPGDHQIAKICVPRG
jgi:hypothetical protein